MVSTHSGTSFTTVTPQHLCSTTLTLTVRLIIPLRTKLWQMLTQSCYQRLWLSTLILTNTIKILRWTTPVRVCSGSDTTNWNYYAPSSTMCSKTTFCFQATSSTTWMAQAMKRKLITTVLPLPSKTSTSKQSIMLFLLSDSSKMPSLSRSATKFWRLMLLLVWLVA